nr:MAG TPA: hypothetical protein [Caudoviricetes sp.]
MSYYTVGEPNAFFQFMFLLFQIEFTVQRQKGENRAAVFPSFFLYPAGQGACKATRKA